MKKYTLLLYLWTLSTAAWTQANVENLPSSNLKNIKIAYQNGQYLEAKDALDSLKVPVQHPDFVASKLLEAKITFEFEDLEKAIHQVDTVLLKSKKTDTLYWDGLLTKAEFLASEWNYFNQADSLFKIIEQQLADKKLPATWKIRLGNSRGDWALTHYEFDLTEKIIRKHKSYQDSLGIPDSMAYFTTLRLFADLYELKKDKDAALKYLNLAEEWAKQIDLLEHPNYGYLCIVAGYLFRETIGDAKQAILYSLKTEAIYKKAFGINHQIYNRELSNLAVAYLNLEDYPNAEKWFLKALEGDERMKITHYPYAIKLMNLAKLYVEVGDYNRAMIIAKKAKKLSEQGNAKTFKLYGKICLLISKGFFHSQEYTVAEDWLKKAEKIFINHKDSISLIRTYNLLADLSYQNNEIDSSAYYCELILNFKHASVTDNTQILLPTYKQLGLVYQKKQNYPLALEMFEKAKNSCKKHLGIKSIAYANLLSRTTNILTELPQQEALAYHYLLEANNILKEKLDYIFPTLNEEARVTFLENTTYISHSFFAFAQDYHQQFPQLRTALQNLKLDIDGLGLENSRNLMMYAKTNDESNEDYYDWLHTRKKISSTYVLSSEQRQEEQINLDSLTYRMQILEKKLGWKIPQNQAKLANVESLKNKLLQKEATIDFFHYQTNTPTKTTVHYGALVFRKEMEQPVFVALGTEDELEPLLATNIRAEGNNYLFNTSINDEIFEKICAPILPHLKGIRQLHIVPTGLLHNLSFGSLKNKKNDYLIEQFDMVYHQSLRDFIQEKKLPSSQPKIALFGGASYDLDSLDRLEIEQDTAQLEDLLAVNDSPTIRSMSNDSLRSALQFSYLSGTKIETEKIKSLFLKKKDWLVENFTGKNALEDHIKAYSSKNAPQILHIATHGFFFKALDLGAVKTKNLRESLLIEKNPLLRSGLALANANYAWLEGKTIKGKEDGILTAFEIYQLDLQHTPLVVLSACNTGRGDIRGSEGVFGLQRAFKVAGVDQLISSLWEVPDKETALLMEYFYTYILKGKSAEIALAKAQRKLQKQHKLNPFYWGAFVLID